MNKYEQLRSIRKEILQLQQILNHRQKKYDKLRSEIRGSKVGNAYTLDAHCDIIELQN